MRTAAVRLAALAALASASGSGCRADRTRSELRPVVRFFSLSERDQQVAAINEGEYRLELARIRLERESSVNAGPMPPELAQSILSRLIERRLLKLEADRLGVRVSTTAVARELLAVQSRVPDAQFRKTLVDTFQTEDDLRAVIEERLAVGKLMGQESHKGVVVQDEEIKKAWELMPVTERIRPARVHAAQIVVPTEEEGEAVIKALLARQDFAMLARKHSVGPEAVRGGDLGWFEMGVMPRVFDDVCFTLKPGEVSTLTPSGYGFHVFKVIDFEPARELSFEEAKDRLHAKLLQEKLQVAETGYVHRLREKYRIERDDRALSSIE
jgi:parvulin-like peptidyl-prolyl isomerase